MFKKIRAKSKELHRTTFVHLAATPAEIEIAATRVWRGLTANILILLFGVLLTHNYWPGAISYAVGAFILWAIVFLVAARDKEAIFRELAAEFRENGQGGMSV